MTRKATREVLVAEVRDAEVTIVGGGAIGCAVAYVLAGAGYRDIQVVEQGELAGATSGQAAGLVGQVRATRERCLLAMSSVAMYSRIEQETPWWVPTAVDNKIFKRVLGAIQRLLAELSTDRNHPLRQRFDVALDHFVERLNTSPEFAARVDAWKEDFLDNEAARKFSASLWQEGKEALARRAEQAEGSSPDIIEHALTMFGLN